MAQVDPDNATVHVGPPTTEHTRSHDPLDQLREHLEPGGKGTLGRLGRYDLLEVIGQGGFGFVIKALDRTLERFVAIKILLPRAADLSTSRKAFLREARSAAKVRHKNVVQIHGVEEEPIPYLVMEYIQGETLEDKLEREGRLSPEEAAEIGRQVAQGLGAAHSTGLIHRDIKPANILLEQGDSLEVKLTDFGIARVADEPSLTSKGFVIGTPMYMSPEQANGETLDHRSDLFSLGSVLYSMLTGRCPFCAPTTLAVLSSVCNDRPKPIRRKLGPVGEGVAMIVDRLHAKSPEGRYASALEVADLLEQCQKQTLAIPKKKTDRVLWWLGSAAAVLLLALGVGLISGAFSGSNQASRVKPRLDIPSVPKPPSWEETVANLPVQDRVRAVLEKLQVLNPEYKGTRFEPKIEGDAVTELTIYSAYLRDISPLRAFSKLKMLRIESEWDGDFALRGALRDLSPLRGMPLEELHVNNNCVADLSPLAGLPLHTLSLWDFSGSDLSPLKGLRLKFLNCGCSPVNDLSPLRGMPLTFLCVNISQVADISPLEGMPLEELLVERTRVSDLSVAKAMPLKVLGITDAPIEDYDFIRTKPIRKIALSFDKNRDLELLRAIPTLQIINDQPADQFLAKAVEQQ